MAAPSSSSSSSSSPSPAPPPPLSWIDIPADCDFGLLNIPFGVCSFPPSDPAPRCCTAIGAYAADLSLLAEAGLLDHLVATAATEDDGCDEREEIIVEFHPRSVFGRATLNEFMACERRVWAAVRDRLISLFSLPSSPDGSDHGCAHDDRLRRDPALRSAALRSLRSATTHLPADIGDYTDFYSSREHATNVGTMFRGRDSALQPNWTRLPVGYHGRSSTVFSSGPGAAVRRPCGQLQIDKGDAGRGSRYGPSARLDFELEVAFFVGGGKHESGAGGGGDGGAVGRTLTISEASERIFGYVLMNDWSARDIQKWEYVPLGPFTSKNFATTISPWVVTRMALEPFRCATSAGRQDDPEPLDYLRDPRYGSYDVDLSVSIRGEGMSRPAVVCESNLRHLYWSSEQQLVHHSVTGCEMRAGDLLASGTISGDRREAFGSMLELSWGGTREVNLGEGEESGETRTFLNDGDEVVIAGSCRAKDGAGRVGFGTCGARVLPARPFGADVGASEARETETARASDGGPRFARFKLYGHCQSSCSWRVRVALAAKGIAYEGVSVPFFDDDVDGGRERANFSPTMQVPVLEFVDNRAGRAAPGGGDGGEDGKSAGVVVRVSQSLAIIEFIETAFPDRGGSLLPADPLLRARAKEMAEVVNSGVQPLQDEPVTGRIDRLCADTGGPATAGLAFGRSAIEAGLATLERLATEFRGDGAGGPFAVGTFGPTVADACIVPQLRNARRFGVDVGEICPVLLGIERACAAHPWFELTRPEAQPDFDAGG